MEPAPPQGADDCGGAAAEHRVSLHVGAGADNAAGICTTLDTMASGRRLHHTYPEYLRLEGERPLKHEYCDGEIFAMAGGTPEHGALAAEAMTHLRGQLPTGCRVLSSDVRIRIEASDLATYPDASVVCGPLERGREDAHAVTNPVLVLEVTSPSSEDSDRGEKLSHYKQLPSLQTVLILSHRTRRLTVVERGPAGWAVTEFRATEVARCATPALTLDVDALYAVLEGLCPITALPPRRRPRPAARPPPARPAGTAARRGTPRGVARASGRPARRASSGSWRARRWP